MVRELIQPLDRLSRAEISPPLLSVGGQHMGIEMPKQQPSIGLLTEAVEDGAA